MLCSGIDIKHPVSKYENGMLKLSFAKRDTAMDFSYHCDNANKNELSSTHPVHILENSDFKKKFEQYLE